MRFPRRWKVCVLACVAALLPGGAVRESAALSGEAGGKSDDVPRIGFRFDDKANQGELPATMRFGVFTVIKGKPAKLLTSHPLGLTNNTCVKVDGSERLLGLPPGEWKEKAAKLGKDGKGAERKGVKSIWVYPKEK